LRKPSGPDSITAPLAIRRSKASKYNSRTSRTADEVPIMNSAPLRSSACEMRSLPDRKAIGISRVMSDVRRSGEEMTISQIKAFRLPRRGLSRCIAERVARARLAHLFGVLHGHAHSSGNCFVVTVSDNGCETAIPESTPGPSGRNRPVSRNATPRPYRYFRVTLRPAVSPVRDTTITGMPWL
jgi:hypothetical protein